MASLERWVRATLKNALEGEGMLSDPATAQTLEPAPPVLDAPLPGWRPHRLDNGDWGSIYLGDPGVEEQWNENAR